MYIMGEEEISPQNNSSEVTRKSRSVYWGSKINSKCPPCTVTWKAGCQHPEPGMSLPPTPGCVVSRGGASGRIYHNAIFECLLGALPPVTSVVHTFLWDYFKPLFPDDPTSSCNQLAGMKPANPSGSSLALPSTIFSNILCSQLSSSAPNANFGL